MNSRAATQRVVDMAESGAGRAPPASHCLREYAEKTLRRYFADLDGHDPSNLYEFVLAEVEQPLFRTLLEYTRGNQSRAAAILGINRSTLRKKLRQYKINT